MLIYDTILQIVKQINIVQFITQYINLTKIGKNIFALCPFHQDKNPSLIINEEQQYFYCFGCKNSGNIIDFLKRYKNYDFITALKEIASNYNITINLPSQNNAVYIKNNMCYQALTKLNKFFTSELYNIKEQYSLKKFLLEKDINLESINNFSLGYCPKEPNKWNLFVNTLTNEEISCLLEIGIVKYSYYTNLKNTYCIFQNRLIFPLFDDKGKIIGFGGRSLSSTSFSKYLNSPNSICFEKKKFLYGLYQVLQKDHTPKKIIVVEGYLDVISLHQYGIYYAVGLLGTHISEYNLTWLLTITKHIIFCYDGDEAGHNAAWETLKNILSYIQDEHQINFMFLPYREDPNSLIKKENKLSFESRIDNAIPFYEFLLNKLYKDIIKDNNLYDQILFIKNYIKIIKPIKSIYLKSSLMYLLKQKVEFVDVLYWYNKSDLLHHKTTTKTPKTPTLKYNLMLLISILILNPKLYKLAVPLLYLIDNFNNKYVKVFIQIVKNCNKNIDTTGKLVEYFRNTKYIILIKKLANKLSHNFYLVSLKQEILQNLFIDLIFYIHKTFLQTELEQLKQKQTGLNQDEKNRIWKTIVKLKTSKPEILYNPSSRSAILRVLEKRSKI